MTVGARGFPAVGLSSVDLQNGFLACRFWVFGFGVSG